MSDDNPHIEDFAKGNAQPNAHASLDEAKPHELEAMLRSFQMRHKALDGELENLRHAPYLDGLKIQRLKKEKLHLKDQMTKISAVLYPDIIA